MILNNEINSQHGGDGALAQVGWDISIDQSPGHDYYPYYFYEYADASGNDPGPHYLTAVPTPVDRTQADFFMVYYVAGSGGGTGTIYYAINGTIKAHTSGVTWKPNGCQWFNETLYDPYDPPAGLLAYHEYFHAVQYQTGGSWVVIDAPSYVYNDIPRADEDWPTSGTMNKFWVWDTWY